jgi:hypothetical protein
MSLLVVGAGNSVLIWKDQEEEVKRWKERNRDREGVRATIPQHRGILCDQNIENG